MVVSELIDFLKQFPLGMPIVFRCYSEACVLKPHEIVVEEMSIPRPRDGWVHAKRPDVPSQKYLVFPGN